MDNEIVSSLKNMKQAESDLNHTLYATFEPKKNPWGDDYGVPHFGEDVDIRDSKANLKVAEETFGHELQASFEEPDAPKRNYFVPHFGTDTDIVDAKSNLAQTEKKLNHTLTTPEEEKIDRNYFVPHFGADTNINASMKNLKDAEMRYTHDLKVKPDGQGSYILLQTDSEMNLESDPICSSAGCTQYKHAVKGLGYKINYPVPNFGRDHDINDNHESLEWAENSLNHKWTWKKSTPKPDPVTYYDNGPMDADVASTMTHLKD